MGKETTVRIGHAEAAIVGVACLILMWSSVLNLLAFLIVAIQGTAEKTERAGDVSRHDRRIYGARSIQSLDQSVGNAPSFAFGRIAEKPKNTDLNSTRNISGNIDRLSAVVLNKILNIVLERNESSSRRDNVMTLVGQVRHFGGRSANPASFHAMAGDGKSASRVGGYFTPT